MFRSLIGPSSGLQELRYVHMGHVRILNAPYVHILALKDLMMVR